MVTFMPNLQICSDSFQICSLCKFCEIKLYAIMSIYSNQQISFSAPASATLTCNHNDCKIEKKKTSKIGLPYSLLVLKLKGVLHPWALFLKDLCIFSKNKATSDKVSYGSGQKCSKELKNISFTSVETIVVKL